MGDNISKPPQSDHHHGHGYNHNNNYPDQRFQNNYKNNYWLNHHKNINDNKRHSFEPRFENNNRNNFNNCNYRRSDNFNNWNGPNYNRNRNNFQSERCDNHNYKDQRRYGNDRHFNKDRNNPSGWNERHGDNRGRPTNDNYNRTVKSSSTANIVPVLTPLANNLPPVQQVVLTPNGFVPAVSTATSYMIYNPSIPPPIMTTASGPAYPFNNYIPVSSSQVPISTNLLKRPNTLDMTEETTRNAELSKKMKEEARSSSPNDMEMDSPEHNYSPATENKSRIQINALQNSTRNFLKYLIGLTI